MMCRTLLPRTSLFFFLSLLSTIIEIANSQSSNTVRYKVLVENESQYPIQVYFFTKPAQFNDINGIYTNSLGTQIVQPKRQSQAQFEIEKSFYAAAQRQTLQTGELQYTSVAMRKIGIETDGQQAQRTVLSFDANEDPVLGDPVIVPTTPGAPSNAVLGSFQMQTPPYQDGLTYRVGLGLVTNGEYQVASYVLAQPGVTINVQPIVTFYVAMGKVEKGVDANFFSVSNGSAFCDASGGTTTFHVIRTNLGQWKVNGVLQPANMAPGTASIAA